MTDSSVLFCIFNRPEPTRRVFQRIAAARPNRLLVVGDAARTNRPDERLLVDQCRSVIDDVDWDCDVMTNFADVNMGCKRRIASGITWGFEQTDELIILEDDCLPDPTFFQYCDQLLDRYRDQPQIAMISGNNFQPTSRSDASYYFSHWPHIWGWATWKRAWQHFDADVSDWPQQKNNDFFKHVFPADSDRRHWQQVMDNQHAGQIDTWDFPWAYACWKTGGLTILPDQNLVTNIGFGRDATHTTDAQSRLAELPTVPLNEIVHPQSIERNVVADEYTLNHVMSVSSEALPDPSSDSSSHDPAHVSDAQSSSRWHRFRKRFGRHLRQRFSTKANS